MQIEQLLPFFAPLIIITVFSFFGYIFYKSNKKASIELGKQPLYTERVAGKIDTLYYKGPFIRLALYDTFLVLGYTKTLVIYYHEITSIGAKKRLFGELLTVTFLQNGKSKEIHLASMNMKSLRSTIEDQIQEGPTN